MLLGLTLGQKLVLGGMAVVFIAFALASAFLLPQRNPDFPGPRGVRWFVLAALTLFMAMLLTVILVREDEEEGHGAAEAAAVEDVTETSSGTGTEAGAAGRGDADAGADVFAAGGCGGCHTFAAADSQGTVGPSLDTSSIDFEGAVTQIRNGGDGMPPFGQELSDEQIADVAAFVVERRGG